MRHLPNLLLLLGLVALITLPLVLPLVSGKGSAPEFTVDGRLDLPVQWANPTSEVLERALDRSDDRDEEQPPPPMRQLDRYHREVVLVVRYFANSDQGEPLAIEVFDPQLVGHGSFTAKLGTHTATSERSDDALGDLSPWSSSAGYRSLDEILGDHASIFYSMQVLGFGPPTERTRLERDHRTVCSNCD